MNSGGGSPGMDNFSFVFNPEVCHYTLSYLTRCTHIRNSGMLGLKEEEA
jgi:hypothetical protein